MIDFSKARANHKAEVLDIEKVREILCNNYERAMREHADEVHCGSKYGQRIKREAVDTLVDLILDLGWGEDYIAWSLDKLMDGGR